MAGRDFTAVLQRVRQSIERMMGAGGSMPDEKAMNQHEEMLGWFRSQVG